MTTVLNSIDQHIAWIRAQDTRRDAEIQSLTTRLTTLQTEKDNAATEINALEQARDTLAANS